MGGETYPLLKPIRVGRRNGVCESSRKRTRNQYANTPVTPSNNNENIGFNNTFLGFGFWIIGVKVRWKTALWSMKVTFASTRSSVSEAQPARYDVRTPLLYQ